MRRVRLVQARSAVCGTPPAVLPPQRDAPQSGWAPVAGLVGSKPYENPGAWWTADAAVTAPSLRTRRTLPRPDLSSIRAPEPPRPTLVTRRLPRRRGHTLALGLRAQPTSGLLAARVPAPAGWLSLQRTDNSPLQPVCLLTSQLDESATAPTSPSA